MLMLLDTSINMAMQPFKMLVGDMVNEKQKGLAYSMQSFLCNAGSVVGYVAPFVLAWFLSNTAPSGQVPPTVTWAFYLGAIILALCVIYTFAKVKEMPPHEYALFHGIDEKKNRPAKKKIYSDYLSKHLKFLDCWCRTIFLLGGLPLYVDILHRCSCSSGFRRSIYESHKRYQYQWR